jgi:hypothetical protein
MRIDAQRVGPSFLILRIITQNIMQYAKHLDRFRPFNSICFDLELTVDTKAVQYAACSMYVSRRRRTDDRPSAIESFLKT